MAGDTLLITRQGMQAIKDAVGAEIHIWNGKRWSKVTPFQTGQAQKLYRVRFGDGSYLDATEYHRFFVSDGEGTEYREVQTKDLLAGSNYILHTEPFAIAYGDGLNIEPTGAYALGVNVGGGDAMNYVSTSQGNDRSASAVSGAVAVAEVGFGAEVVRRLKTDPEALNAIARWKKEAILAFIAGLADAKGTATPNRIWIEGLQERSARRVQLLLTKCGLHSTIHPDRFGENIAAIEICDRGEIPCQRLDIRNGDRAEISGDRQTIESVEELPGLHETYCFNEPEFHKGVFGNTLTGNCNLAEIHLNQIDPQDHQAQEDAFKAGALSVAILLNHKFTEPRYHYSRQIDPIVGVSFTGLFDFFVQAFGADWLRWWEQGRPDSGRGLEFKRLEREYLTRWRDIVHAKVWDYCDRHNLRRPNRCTTIQPSGTKSLLTGASPGWHPPKAQRFIRRITFRKNDPVALACIDYGYNVVPSQSDKDDLGNLLDDPFDPRCCEWLVEIPVATPWADLPGCDDIDISKFSALAQFDFYMQVQRHYTTHNSSATIELRESEIEALGTRIYEAIRDDEGYISAALLARFDDLQTFPRLPFEPVDKATYEACLDGVLKRRKIADFHQALSQYDRGEMLEAGPAGCDSDKCLLPEDTPQS
ncbi:ribonucleoside-triphosphate reductase, adenosylcobalamin-dependent [Phormidium sp. CCY1219]|uniref:ribonucleoside-triphosphate reductase, adenosylcobalamin-dependent n=1 Tax=Phormidium sp. CCY1219 TaxID=2886104 RepID=UPI002D1F1273|nr:ribonucleoside-triphosphate reductase, adenosylcobalamin-dependent [Phormidium sp. CCY1219]MEB3827350.1 ribonucleoside-triphosphate reductase, adenosylcobalamin-dependent [Phormidium sp. CCY1219]